MSMAVAPARTRLSRIAEEARERVRLTVVPRPRTRTSRVPFIALVTLLLLGGVVGLLLFNTSMQQASFAATALQQQADDLSAQQQTLAMQLDNLRDPQRVAREAHAMGMVPSCAPMFLRLGAHGGGTILGQPAGAQVDCTLRIPAYPARKPAALTPPATVITVPPPAATTTSTPAKTATAGQPAKPAAGVRRGLTARGAGAR